MEIAQIIDKAIKDHYDEIGKPVPQWRRQEPQWWREYLTHLGLDPRNP